MAIPSRGIGWSTEDNLLWQISKQLEQLTNVTAQACANNAPTYKVYTALLTQSGDDDPQSISSGALVKGITYHVIGGGGGNEDFSNVGLPVFYDGAYFVATQNAEPINWDGAALEYNTGAPVATVLDNTIGNIWFTFQSTGQYYTNSNVLFTDNKTTVFGGYYDANTGIWINYQTNNISNSTIPIQTGDPLPANGYLNNTPIEIRVYN